MLLLAACSPSASPTGTLPSEPATEAPGSEAPAAGSVEVTLQDGVVTVAPDSAAAGEVTFAVTNDGPDAIHEFVIIRTDLAPDELPTADDGSVDESSGDIEVVDEIEGLDVGATEELTVTLEAGSYVLVCNVVDSDFGSHYAAGMRAAFTVE
jgi:uncharacterized cupredoxin-like copper-binding protein